MNAGLYQDPGLVKRAILQSGWRGFMWHRDVREPSSSSKGIATDLADTGPTVDAGVVIGPGTKSDKESCSEL